MNADCGARSPVAGLAAATLVFLALYVVAPALQYIPKAVLSAIIFVAMLKMIDIQRAKEFYRVNWRCVCLSGVSGFLAPFLHVFCVPCCRDFLVYLVVFALSLVIGSEVAILAGVAINWFLTLAFPYTEVTEVCVLKVQRPEFVSTIGLDIPRGALRTVVV